MDYKETLEVVKGQNPGLSHKECQKKASILFNAYKAGQAQLKDPGGAGVKKAPNAPTLVPRLAGAIPTAALHDAELSIRKGPIDVSKIMAIGFQVIPDGRIVNWGKADNPVNSLVTFEDRTGNKLPVEGYFEIYL